MDSKRVGDQTVHVYQAVIDDVIARVKPEFVQEGVDESVLDELRALWEAKLVQTGVVGDPNQAETAQVLGTAQPPRPGVVQYRQPGGALPGAVPGAMGLQQFPPRAQFQQLAGMAQAMMGPQAMQLQAAQLQAALQHQAALAAAQGQRFAVPPGALPPNAAALQAASAQQQAALAAAAAAAEDRKRKLEGLPVPAPKREQLGSIPQQDGPGDDGGEEGGEGDDPTTTEAATAGEGDEELNEDDDLAAVDDEEVDEEQLKDVVLGQFDKVSRTKARWKVQLRDCIITAHGRDYLVHKATGEMNF